MTEATMATSYADLKGNLISAVQNLAAYASSPAEDADTFLWQEGRDERHDAVDLAEAALDEYVASLEGASRSNVGPVLDQAEWHRGYHEARVAEERDDDSSAYRRERAFAEAWRLENKGRSPMLALLMLKSEAVGISGLAVRDDHLHAHVGLRESRIVATVMQWLGSNIGFSFLETTLARAGYRIEPADAPVRRRR
jgi:hypothetical protein